MELAELHDLIAVKTDRMLSPRRAAHSHRVAELAGELCGRHGIDPLRGRVAGLAHDICREMPKHLQTSLASRCNAFRPDQESEYLAEHLPHGPAAAAWLEEGYGTIDRDILEAVAVHTTGIPDMGMLAAIVYCADKLEPGRACLPPAFRSRCIDLPVHAMVVAVCERSMHWLEEAGLPVAPHSARLIASFSVGKGL